MPRRPRIESAGFHHIINRGVEKRKIFMDDSDKDKFLEILCEVAKHYQFKIHSYCLMDNHYHLLLENTLENLSLGMRQLNSSYAKYFNKRYTRVGHLWQGRYKSWFVINESYLFILFKYIESNPLKAEMTQKIGQYKYSLSYKILNNLLDDCTQNSFVLTWYDVKEFSYLIDQKLTQEEQKNIEKIHHAKIEIKENKPVQKLENRTLNEYFHNLDTLSKVQRDEQIIKAYEDSHTQVAIAKFLGISNVMVSKIIKRLKVKA